MQKPPSNYCKREVQFKSNIPDFQRYRKLKVLQSFGKF